MYAITGTINRTGTITITSTINMHALLGKGPACSASSVATGRHAAGVHDKPQHAAGGIII